jgi:hypothetical protein
MDICCARGEDEDGLNETPGRDCAADAALSPAEGATKSLAILPETERLEVTLSCATEVVLVRLEPGSGRSTVAIAGELERLG